MISQRGGFALGLIVGLLLGLALALGVALYVTKVPVPFLNKVPQRTAEQDAAEIEHLHAVQHLLERRVNAQRLLNLLRRHPRVRDEEIGRRDLVRGEELLDLLQSE